MRKPLFISLLLLAVLCYGCGSGGSSNKPKETTTSGDIKISIDKSLRPVMKEQLQVFESSYPKAHIEAQYKSEVACFKDFFSDSSIRMIIVTRDLTTEEKKALDYTRSLKIAKGAIALVVHPGSPDTLMTVGQLKHILTNNFIRKYNVVFDNAKSGTVRYLLDSLIQRDTFASNVYTMNSSDSVLKYVANHKNALGIVGVMNVFTGVDTGVGTFKQGIKVVALRNDSTYDFYKPYQAYVALKLYPLSRPIYFISHDSWQSLATGFANFLAGDRGQLIFKHARLVPMQVPLNIRRIRLKH